MTDEDGFAPPRDPTTARKIRRATALGAVLFTVLGVGAGHAYAGRPLPALAWLSVRVLGGAVMLCASAVLPSLVLVAVLGSFLWPFAITAIAAVAGARTASRTSSRPRSALALAVVVVGLLAIVTETWITRTFLVETTTMKSASMEPTMANGDVLQFAKGPLLGTPSRGDLVTFHRPLRPGVDLLKRVVGIEGDVIAFEAGQLVRNGNRLTGDLQGEAWYFDDNCEQHTALQYVEDGYTVLVDPVPGRFADTSAVTVPPGQVFVAGDNRDHSEDSRQFGFVSVEDVVGSVRGRWLARHPCDASIRWDRIGPVQ